MLTDFCRGLPLSQVRVKVVRLLMVCDRVPLSELESTPAAVEESVQAVPLTPPLHTTVMVPRRRTRLGVTDSESSAEGALMQAEPPVGQVWPAEQLVRVAPEQESTVLVLSPEQVALCRQPAVSLTPQALLLYESEVTPCWVEAA